MSARVTIVCDSDVDETDYARSALCREEYASDSYSLDAVRTWAAEAGWIRIDDEYDICPCCARATVREEVP